MAVITVGSLFSGIGGLDLGLERAGMEVRWQVEIDAYCSRVLAKHWPDVERHRDVREVGAHNLVPVDLICGGFPCQPHSLAGQRKGKNDERHLWPEYRRIVDELRPTWVLGENVPGIRTTALDDIILDLEGMGYTVGTFDIPACAVGAPHLRHRFFIVAHADGTGCQEQRWAVAVGTEQRPAECGGAEMAYAGCGDGRPRGQGRLEHGGEGVRVNAHADVADTASGRTESCGAPCNVRELQDEVLPEGGHSRYWSVEPNVGRVANGVPSRVDRLRALGNAVVPQVAEYIGRMIVAADECL